MYMIREIPPAQLSLSYNVIQTNVAEDGLWQALENARLKQALHGCYRVKKEAWQGRNENPWSKWLWIENLEIEIKDCVKIKENFE